MAAREQYRTQLGHVRGLGSAKEGVHHWWTQRISSVALVPLSLWFVASIVSMTGASHARVSAWLASPLTFGLMSLLIVATFYHASLGVQVVLEDYVHREGSKIAAILLAKALCLCLALAALIALFTVAFGD